MNYMKTAILFAGLTALFMAAGLMLGGAKGAMMALVAACGMNLWALYNSDKAVLRRYNAKEITDGDVYHLTAQLAKNANLPMPALYVIDSAQPNAFATGRNPDNAAVAVTSGIVKALTPAELGGVIAHELAHIQNRDTLIMTLTATISGALSTLANFGFLARGKNQQENPLGGIGLLVMMVAAPFMATLVQLAISRTREYAADKRGAQICSDPEALASALEKISIAAQRIPNMPAENNPASAHLFIINPLGLRKIDNLFATHPNTANRIAALRQLEL